jgi:hypothetical protein
MESIRIKNVDGIFYRNQDGLNHRENGPAIIFCNGEKKWFINGLLHRLDGPAHIWADKDRDWYFNGMFHRVRGAAINRGRFIKYWYRNDLKHRLNAPALTDHSHHPNNQWWEFGIKIK